MPKGQHRRRDPEVPRARLHSWFRGGILLLLVATTLAEGLNEEPSYFWSVTALAATLGAASWILARFERAEGRSLPPLLGRAWICAFFVLVAFQMAPLPPGLLRLLSPGSYHAWFGNLLVPVREWLSLRDWRPITVTPRDTLETLLFAVAMALLYAATAREFRTDSHIRVLVYVIVSTGIFLTLEALHQLTTANAAKVCGIWSVPDDWAVFGCFTNRNHFGGYMAMTVPLALGLLGEAIGAMARAWTRRRVGWLVLGEAYGSAVLWRAAIAVVLVVGLFATQSRGGLMAFCLSSMILPFAFPHRLRAALVVGAVGLLGSTWVDFGGMVRGFETRGIRASRVDLWTDVLRMVKDFPMFGSGFGSFPFVYVRYQNVWKILFADRAHNEYLQVLVETGALGAGFASVLMALLLASGFRGSRGSPLAAGALGGFLACALHCLVDFDWHILASAATCVGLAGIIASRSVESGGDGRVAAP